MAAPEGPQPLPTGTIAFLMTDIEGSTQLVGRLGPAWPSVLDRHFTLMRATVAAHGGTWVSSEGDSVFAVFPSVRQAISAAVAAQRATAVDDAGGHRVKVRMGIHAGEAMLGGRDYTGMEVHHTARLAGAGHGGQILVSEAARSLAAELPAADLAYHDLGRHQLRDIPGAELIHQVVVSDLPSEFPRLRTETSSAPTNLPVPPTRFVGRIEEVREGTALLQRERLVTLTGPGGTGKTRVAIEIARVVGPGFAHGPWFVALDVVREPALVVPTIAATLGVVDQPGRPIANVLADHLADNDALLVLDNVEQVVDAAPEIGELLAAAPNVRILASSREPLGIAGEAVYPIAPLGVPDEPGKPTADQVAGSDAVALFVDRATSIRSDFRLTDANAPAVAAICRRLDGLPLALELAAARINLLSPDQILTRLDQRLNLLASSRRDVPDRQRTLRGAIDWSHDLLSEPERLAFRRFSVFSGGADFESLAKVVDPHGELPVDVLDLASALVDRSLVRSIADGEDRRLHMLETIREYAAEQLLASGETRQTRDRHAVHFQGLVEAVGDVLTNPRRDEILDRLDMELPNLRAAMSWSLEGGSLDVGLAIASGLTHYWHIRGSISEGRAALAALLTAHSVRPPTVARARATAVATSLAVRHGDLAAAAALGAETLRLAEELDDPQLLLAAQIQSGFAAVGPRPAVAREHFERAIDLARTQMDEMRLRYAMQGLASALFNLGELDEAMALSVEHREHSERAGDRYNMAFADLGIATIKLRLGDIAGTLTALALAYRGFRQAGADVGIAMVLDIAALAALALGDPARAARLGSFADRLGRTAGGGGGILMSNDEPPLVQARRLMDPAEFDRAVAQGETLDLDQAAVEAFQEDAR